MSVNERIKIALDKKDISYDQLGKILGITRGGVSNRINSKTEITSDKFIDAVVELTGISKDWILHGKEEVKSVSDLGVYFELLEKMDFHNEGDQALFIEMKVHFFEVVNNTLEKGQDVNHELLKFLYTQLFATYKKLMHTVFSGSHDTYETALKNEMAAERLRKILDKNKK